MTEYWKSQARKYCDFCKCWMADNKVSISFHESGKRHKESVQKHISVISKKSAKDFKQQQKLDDDIKKMEAAAMAAYLEDVKNNADLTSQDINNMLNKNNDDAGSSSRDSPLPIVKIPKKPIWNEVKSEKGNYYWNTETGETTWDPPDEYLSLAEQEEIELKKKEKEKKKEMEQQRKKEKKEKQKEKDMFKEVNAQLSREKMREKAVKQENSSLMGPVNRPADPYGRWQTVEHIPEEPVDLELPKVEKEEIVPAVVIPPEERVRFKEKKVESLGEGPVEFKKRKFNNPKRNMRQKCDDD